MILRQESQLRSLFRFLEIPYTITDEKELSDIMSQLPNPKTLQSSSKKLGMAVGTIGLFKDGNTGRNKFLGAIATGASIATNFYSMFAPDKFTKINFKAPNRNTVYEDYQGTLSFTNVEVWASTAPFDVTRNTLDLITYAAGNIPLVGHTYAAATFIGQKAYNKLLDEISKGVCAKIGGKIHGPIRLSRDYLNIKEKNQQNPVFEQSSYNSFKPKRIGATKIVVQPDSSKFGGKIIYKNHDLEVKEVDVSLTPGIIFVEKTGTEETVEVKVLAEEPSKNLDFDISSGTITSKEVSEFASQHGKEAWYTIKIKTPAKKSEFPVNYSAEWAGQKLPGAVNRITTGEIRFRKPKLKISYSQLCTSPGDRVSFQAVLEEYNPPYADIKWSSTGGSIANIGEFDSEWIAPKAGIYSITASLKTNKDQVVSDAISYKVSDKCNLDVTLKYSNVMYNEDAILLYKQEYTFDLNLQDILNKPHTIEPEIKEEGFIPNIGNKETIIKPKFQFLVEEREDRYMIHMCQLSSRMITSGAVAELLFAGHLAAYVISPKYPNGEKNLLEECIINKHPLFVATIFEVKKTKDGGVETTSFEHIDRDVTYWETRHRLIWKKNK